MHYLRYVVFALGILSLLLNACSLRFNNTSSPDLSYSESSGKNGVINSAMEVKPSTLSAGNMNKIISCQIKPNSLNSTLFPSGLTIESSTCVISGTPTSPLPATEFTIIAANATGASIETKLTLSVDACNPESKPFGGGYGTQTDPFLICSTTHLDNMRTSLNSDFKQTKDLDLKTTSFTPIGSSSEPFTGVYDGDNHTISNWTYKNESADNVGLFSYVSGAAKISNLGVLNVDIVGNAAVGAIVGMVGSNTTAEISNSYSTGKIVAPGNQIGGIVGELSSGKISDSYSEVSVQGRGDIGGLVGKTHGLITISRSHATGNIIATRTSNNYAGGLVGSIVEGANISDSYATGSISTINGTGVLGGLVGKIWPYPSVPTTITDCYATGNVSTGGRNGGLIGDMSYTTVTRSYATGSVSSTAITGGLVGYAISSSSIIESYATGDVTVSTVGNADTGGLVGFASGLSISNSYSKGNVKSTVASNRLGGLIGTALSSTSISKSYATGTVSSLGNMVGGLAGQLDGSTVSNSYSNATVSGSTDVGGLVGRASTLSTVTTSYATGNVSPSFVGAASAGGLIGYALSVSISQSYATGNISASAASQRMGGLVGTLNTPSTLSNSFATGAVSSPSSVVGGLVGLSNGASATITNTFSVGSVSGSANVGGLVGQCNSCGSVNDSFWNTETSGQATSPRGTGKTSSELQAQSTFTNWNFSTIWNSPASGSYPNLR